MLEEPDKPLKSRQKEYNMHHFTQQYIHTALCFTHLKLYYNATPLKLKASIVGKARIKNTVIHMGNTKETSNTIENHPNEQKWLGVSLLVPGNITVVWRRKELQENLCQKK